MSKRSKHRGRQRYRAITSRGDCCTVNAADTQKASLKAVEHFSRSGVVPWDLSHIAPGLPVAGYDFVIAIETDVKRGGSFEGDLFVGFRDETGCYSPCCGSPGALSVYLGRGKLEPVPTAA